MTRATPFLHLMNPIIGRPTNGAIPRVVAAAVVAGLTATGAVKPVHKETLDPETNAWADKGISSQYHFGAHYTRKNTD